MTKFFDEIATLITPGEKAAPAKVAAPAPPKPVAAKPAPSPAPVVAPTPKPEPVVAESHEPTVVEYQPEPAVSSMPAPQGVELVEKLTGKLRGYLRSDGLFVAVTEQPEDELANLKAEDRRPVNSEEEARVDLAQRTSGRIKFLTATYESEKEDPKYPARRTARLANDLARNFHARPASIFDPEDTAVAKELKRWIQ